MKRVLVTSPAVALIIVAVLLSIKLRQNRFPQIQDPTQQTYTDISNFGKVEKYENEKYKKYFIEDPIKITFYYPADYSIEENTYKVSGDIGIEFFGQECSHIITYNNQESNKCSILIDVQKLTDPSESLEHLIHIYSVTQNDDIHPEEFKPTELFGKTVYKGIAAYDPSYTMTGYVTKLESSGGTFAIMIPYLDSGPLAQTLLETITVGGK